ncbi:uncharacterized protein LOC117168252 [Belonocnema kinseyi]|uniref:uncharacterized protein LOC117168252 n=1 Tax=Belonocnema kinseyi TaxID=2817044 RepID=UPI00143CEF7C|nr:uncharacterized protein LOC117168252 [Belonocnema kinseyi]
MLKFLCLLFIFSDVANAAQHKATFHSVEVSGAEENPYVDVKKSKGKTDIVWKTEVNQKSPPLKATFVFHFHNSEQTETTQLENLCIEYEEGTTERSVQKYLLKALANADECPIQNGTSLSVPHSFSLSFSTDDPLCGDVENAFKVFKEMDSKKCQLLITGSSKGTVTGC